MCDMARAIIQTILVLGIGLSAIELVSSLENGDSCLTKLSQRGTCKFIYECAEAIRNIKQGIPRDLCKRGSTVEVVCCATPRKVQLVQPQRPTLQNNNPDVSRMRMADQKCYEYRTYVYETEEVPSFLPTQQAIKKQVDKCGFKAVQLVVGGTQAAPKEFPHMSLLGYGSSNAIQWKCGGSIISRRFVLTAAHCIRTSFGEPSFVLTGDLNIRRTDDIADPRTYQVERSITHPNYRNGENYHDIALIQLTSNMQFNQFARPACLNSQFDPSQRRAIVTGWGDTEFFSGAGSSTLLKVTLDLFQFNECTRKIPSDSKLRNGLIESQQICAGSYNEEKDACEGDSGGPLQIYHDIYCMYKIMGVTSFGKGCATVIGIPGVYTRVSNYIDWIESNAFVHG